MTISVDKNRNGDIIEVEMTVRMPEFKVSQFTTSANPLMIIAMRSSTKQKQASIVYRGSKQSLRR